MAIGYTEIDFVNGSAPALNATNMNKIDEALKDACDILDAETTAGRALVEAADAAAQRTALGLGDSATLDVGTGAGDVAAGNAPAGAVTAHESTYAHANLPTADEKTRLGDIQAASGATTAAKLVTLVNPTATQTASRIPLYNAAKGLNADGISFPATQVPSADVNTLDDYEEGTWTPTFIGATGDSTGTSIEVVGKYVKIGKEVTAWASYKFTSIGGWTNRARFGGFPFTPASLDSFSISSPELDFVDIPQGYLYITCDLNKSSNRLYMYLSGVRDDAQREALFTPSFASSSCMVRYQIKYTV